MMKTMLGRRAAWANSGAASVGRKWRRVSTPFRISIGHRAQKAERRARVVAAAGFGVWVALGGGVRVSRHAVEGQRIDGRRVGGIGVAVLGPAVDLQEKVARPAG